MVKTKDFQTFVYNALRVSVIFFTAPLVCAVLVDIKYCRFPQNCGAEVRTTTIKTCPGKVKFFDISTTAVKYHYAMSFTTE